MYLGLILMSFLFIAMKSKPEVPKRVLCTRYLWLSSRKHMEFQEHFYRGSLFHRWEIFRWLNVNIGWYICIFKGLYKSITDFGIKLILSDHFLYNLWLFIVLQIRGILSVYFCHNEFIDAVVSSQCKFSVLDTLFLVIRE